MWLWESQPKKKQLCSRIQFDKDSRNNFKELCTAVKTGNPRQACKFAETTHSLCGSAES